ncbi:5410_t:CDS:2 [Entrophospora sp. SA101]|nr:5410_t:CDS:2 [Entrophospora sp. SA101]
MPLKPDKLFDLLKNIYVEKDKDSDDEVVGDEEVVSDEVVSDEEEEVDSEEEVTKNQDVEVGSEEKDVDNEEEENGEEEDVTVRGVEDRVIVLITDNENHQINVIDEDGLSSINESSPLHLVSGASH